MNPQLAPAMRTAWRQSLPWLPRFVAVAAVVAGLALAAPLIWGALAAGAGLLALAAMGAVGFVVLQALPLLGQKLENHLLAARKAQARANPIEQLQNDCLRREQRLQSFKAALVAIGGQIETMRERVEERQQIDPTHVLDRQTRAIESMAHFHRCNIGRLDEARAALDAFRQKVQQKTFEWEFAVAADDIKEALHPGDVAGLMQDLLSDEALRAVQLRFNTVFAELDIEMRAVGGPGRSLLDARHLDRLDALRLPTAATPGRLS